MEHRWSPPSTAACVDKKQFDWKKTLRFDRFYLALLSSALKQEEIDSNPQLIRLALENTAQKSADELSVGCRLIQIHKALKWIRSLGINSFFVESSFGNVWRTTKRNFFERFSSSWTQFGRYSIDSEKSIYLKEFSSIDFTWRDFSSFSSSRSIWTYPSDRSVIDVEHGKYHDIAYPDRTLDIRVDPPKLKDDHSNFQSGSNSPSQCSFVVQARWWSILSSSQSYSRILPENRLRFSAEEILQICPSFNANISLKHWDQPNQDESQIDELILDNDLTLVRGETRVCLILRLLFSLVSQINSSEIPVKCPYLHPFLWQWIRSDIGDVFRFEWTILRIGRCSQRCQWNKKKIFFRHWQNDFVFYSGKWEGMFDTRKSINSNICPKKIEEGEFIEREVILMIDWIISSLERNKSSHYRWNFHLDISFEWENDKDGSNTFHFDYQWRIERFEDFINSKHNWISTKILDRSERISFQLINDQGKRDEELSKETDEENIFISLNLSHLQQFENQSKQMMDKTNLLSMRKKLQRHDPFLFSSRFSFRWKWNSFSFDRCGQTSKLVHSYLSVLRQCSTAISHRRMMNNLQKHLKINEEKFIRFLSKCHLKQWEDMNVKYFISSLHSSSSSIFLFFVLSLSKHSSPHQYKSAQDFSSFRLNVMTIDERNNDVHRRDYRRMELSLGFQLS